MKIRFRRAWRKFKAGQESDAIPDGIATTLIRVGAAALVEDEKDVDVSISEHDDNQQADSGDGTDDGASEPERSEETTVSGGVGHKPGRRIGGKNSGRT